MELIMTTMICQRNLANSSRVYSIFDYQTGVRRASSMEKLHSGWTQIEEPEQLLYMTLNSKEGLIKNKIFLNSSSQ